jgi:hypothetical protein
MHPIPPRPRERWHRIPDCSGSVSGRRKPQDAPILILLGIVLGQGFLMWTHRRQQAGRTPLLALEVLDSPEERAAVYAMFAVVALEAALNGGLGEQAGRAGHACVLLFSLGHRTRRPSAGSASRGRRSAGGVTLYPGLPQAQGRAFPR